MKTILALFLLFMNVAASTVYDFKINALDGKLIVFSQYAGKTLLIVNTASECGFTPQYADLQELHETFGSKVTILGFPANNFLGQEPGSNMQIAAFCQKNYGVTFQMFEKISVKGDDMHSLYQFLTQKSKNGLQDSDVEWNFQKYLINEKGELAKVVLPQVLPTDESIVNWLKE